MKLNIYYEDNHVIVVEKPVNVPTQGDSSGDKDLLNIIKDDIKVRYNKPGNVYVGMVHRLDRPVGGVMVFAKTSKASSRLSEQIRNKDFKKTYIAVIHGTPDNKQGRLQDYLLKDSVKNIVHVAEKNDSNAKLAILDYNIIDTVKDLSLVKIDLLTGRSHQIRVQMAHSGHPLLGDQKYGLRKGEEGEQIALWSYKVGFIHPTLKKYMEFKSIPDKINSWKYFNIDKLLSTDN